MAPTRRRPPWIRRTAVAAPLASLACAAVAFGLRSLDRSPAIGAIAAVGVVTTLVGAIVMLTTRVPAPSWARLTCGIVAANAAIIAVGAITLVSDTPLLASAIAVLLALVAAANAHVAREHERFLSG